MSMETEVSVEQLCGLCALAPEATDHKCSQLILEEIDKVTLEIEELEELVKDLKVTRAQMKNELLLVKQKELELYFSDN